MAQVPKIQIRHLRKSFGDLAVLRQVNLDIASGESCVLIGASGSGKSVLIKCLLGLVELDDGQIKIDGKYLDRSYDHFRLTCGMLFQGAALFDSMSVLENVSFPLKQRGWPEKDAWNEAQKALVQVGLSDQRVRNFYPAALSGGMKKRVGLARAIVAKPQVIFFDEPTAGLDPSISTTINRLIRKCVDQLGATALTITHDLASMRRIADRVAMLHNGKIIWNGTLKELAQCPIKTVRAFIDPDHD